MVDMFYGDEMQHKTRWTDLKKGYHDNGEVKRVTGLWYDDIGVWDKTKKEEYES